MLPPTRDREAAAQALAQLRLGAGTAIGDAIERSVAVIERLQQADYGVSDAGVSPGAVLLLSDGAQTGEGVTPQEAAAEARDARIPVYTVAVGTGDAVVEVPLTGGLTERVVVSPDPETLRAVAETTGGRAFAALDSDELATVYRDLATRLVRETREVEVTSAFALGGAASARDRQRPLRPLVPPPSVTVTAIAPTRLAAVAAVALLAAVALALAPRAAHAADECSGLQVCLPVAGPWVEDPGTCTGVGHSRRRSGSSAARCRGYIVAGVDARVSDRGVDVSFRGENGSPVSAGVTTGDRVLFVATSTGPARRAVSFRPFVGCVPVSGGGGRAATSHVRVPAAFPPAQPIERRVTTARVRVGQARTLRATCRPSERLVGVTRSVAIAREAEPSAALLAAIGVSGIDAGAAGPRPRNRGGVAPLGSPRAGPGARALREGARMSFESPWLLASLLGVAAAVGAYLLLERRRARYVVHFTNVDVLASVAGRSRGYRRHGVAVLVVVALAALCVAAARPTVTVAAPLDRATVVLVLDVSGSMRAEDVAPTRLAAAQAAIRRFLDEVPAGLRVGLIAFSDDPQVVAVPTTDHENLLTNLDLLFPQRGTAIGDAIGRAVELARDAVQGDAAATSGPLRTPDGKPLATVLMLSDGAQMGGLLEPLDGAALAREAGVPVYTVGLGTDEGVVEFFRGDGSYRVIQVPPDRETLARIAEATGGEYFDAPDAQRVGEVYAGLGSRLGRVDERREVSALVLAGGAVLLAAAGLLAGLWRPPLP